MSLKRLATCFPAMCILCVASTSIAQDVARYQKVLNIAKECIDEKEWKQAVDALDAALKEPKDLVIDVDIKKKTVKSTVHEEAERLLKSMPRAGREEYEAQFGDTAQALLKVAERDEKKLQQLSRTYLYTKAGAEGTERLRACNSTPGAPRTP